MRRMNTHVHKNKGNVATFGSNVVTFPLSFNANVVTFQKVEVSTLRRSPEGLKSMSRR